MFKTKECGNFKLLILVSCNNTFARLVVYPSKLIAPVSNAFLEKSSAVNFVKLTKEEKIPFILFSAMLTCVT